MVVEGKGEKRHIDGEGGEIPSLTWHFPTFAVAAVPMHGSSTVHGRVEKERKMLGRWEMSPPPRYFPAMLVGGASMSMSMPK